MCRQVTPDVNIVINASPYSSSPAHPHLVSALTNLVQCESSMRSLNCVLQACQPKTVTKRWKDSERRRRRSCVRKPLTTLTCKMCQWRSTRKLGLVANYVFDQVVGKWHNVLGMLEVHVWQRLQISRKFDGACVKQPRFVWFCTCGVVQSLPVSCIAKPLAPSYIKATLILQYSWFKWIIVEK